MNRSANAERQARHRERLAAAGLVQIALFVPVSAAADFARAAELVRENPDLTVARLVSRTTGKLSGLRGNVVGRGKGKGKAEVY